MALPVQVCCWPMQLERLKLPGWQQVLLEWQASRGLVLQQQV